MNIYIINYDTKVFDFKKYNEYKSYTEQNKNLFKVKILQKINFLNLNFCFLNMKFLKERQKIYTCIKIKYKQNIGFLYLNRNFLST